MPKKRSTKKVPDPAPKGHAIVKVGVADAAMFCRCEKKGTCLGCAIEANVRTSYGTQGLEYLRKFIPTRQGGEIRSYPDGLDEVVLFNPAFVHLEQMDTGHWWLGIDMPDGGRVNVNFSSKGRIKAFAEREPGYHHERHGDPAHPPGDPARPV